MNHYIEQAWYFFVVEPFTWLFYYFFQPDRFKAFDRNKDTSQSLSLVLRLLLPMFLLSYVFAIVIHILTASIAGGISGLLPNLISLLPFLALLTILGIVAGVALGAVGGIVGSVTLGLTGGIAGGITGFIAGVIQGFIALGIVAPITLGIVGTILELLVLLLDMRNNKRKRTGTYIIESILKSIGIGATMFVAGLMTGLSIQIMAIHPEVLLAFNARSGVVLGLLLGLILGPTMQRRDNIIVGALFWLVLALVSNPWWLSSVFVIGYLLGYLRLPLFPISGLSSFRAYQKSNQQPQRVFNYLEHSALHWDECVVLPLPGLKKTLLIAATEDAQQALKEITFIAKERHYQIQAARDTALEIIIQELERCGSIRDIAQAFARTSPLLSETQLLDASWKTALTGLQEASHDAALFDHSRSQQIQYEALQSIKADLDDIVYPTVTGRDGAYSKRLRVVVDQWQKTRRQEETTLLKVPREVDVIDNPYAAGQVLRPGNTLFVGRQDLIMQIEKALRQENRSTLFLLGERRMGKTSILKQLPRLLSRAYLAVFYDLQMPGMLSSTATIVDTIASGISEVMDSNGYFIKSLEPKQLTDAEKKNEAEVYHVFQDWLENVEAILEQEQRTLLLTFDEFEKLEAAQRDGYLNLRLLLDWFRHVSQHHPRIALLFSGIHSISDMRDNWAQFFMNVQTLKVGFLQPAEARRLITQPIPDFPDVQIFNEETIVEIIRVTGGHPFLVQAVCSSIIDHLNADQQRYTTVQDVNLAVEKVLEAWGDTYFRDLWERTDQAQRICLLALQSDGTSTLRSITHESKLDEQIIRPALQTLLKRDLVVREGENYRLSAPIYCCWIERSHKQHLPVQSYNFM